MRRVAVQRLCMLLVVALSGAFPVMAQPILYPGESGEMLADMIRADYTPGELLGEGPSKDTLYARVFFQDDSVRCIYSGLARFLPSGVDPSQWLFGSGNEVGSLNLEHGWPQAKGAGDGTPGNRDMHHLYPSRVAINSARANHPLRDIPDPLTQSWYYLDQQMSAIPAQHPERYSEYAKGSFEPRESVKGDMARAMFYFWTIYRADAEAADPAFFSIQREDLCQWHLADPVDGAEWERTHRIAAYQDNTPNPFVLDCTLAERAYCPEWAGCDPVGVVPPGELFAEISLDPGSRQVSVNADAQGLWKIRILDMAGRYLYACTAETGVPCTFGELTPGLYVVLAVHRTGFVSTRFFIR